MAPEANLMGDMAFSICTDSEEQIDKFVPCGLSLIATAVEQGLMMKTIARWRLAAEGAFFELVSGSKLELAGPFCSMTVLYSPF